MKKKISSLIMCFVLVLSMALPVSADSVCSMGTKMELIAGEISPRAGAYTMTRYGTVSNGGRKITVKVNLECRDELGNSSGSYILGISSIKVTGYSGWSSVKSDVTKTAVSYSGNHQTAVIGIKYNASNGAGYHQYSGTVVVNL